MYQNNDPTGLDTFRQQWQAGSRTSGLPAFLTGQDASGQDDQGAQLAQANRQAIQEAQARAQAMMQGTQATMRAQVLQNVSPEVAQGLQDTWAAQDQGGQPQSPSAMMQALQAQARRQQLRTADPDVAQNLQRAWAAQDRTGA